MLTEELSEAISRTWRMRNVCFMYRASLSVCVCVEKLALFAAYEAFQPLSLCSWAHLFATRAFSP